MKETEKKNIKKIKQDKEIEKDRGGTIVHRVIRESLSAEMTSKQSPEAMQASGERYPVRGNISVKALRHQWACCE